MEMAHRMKEAEISEQDSLLLTRNLLRIAIFNISYIRGLFPEKYFSDKSVTALDMKIKKLMPIDAESRRLIDWMEKGVYDALQKKYLRTLIFCVCEAVEGPMIEEYAFSFSYSNGDSQEVSMNVNRIGTKKQGGTFKCNSVTEVTPNQMRSSACKMVRKLMELMRTRDKLPEERTILMKLLYYDDVTPTDYEPPFFKGCTEEKVHNPWTKYPLKMEVGNVNSKHFVIDLKVKSVLDPCENENDDIQDDNVSLGADSMQRDESSDFDSEPEEDEYMFVAIDKQQAPEDGATVEDEDTQDPAEDEQRLSRVKDWIIAYHIDTIELTNVLSKFPDISVVLIEEIMDKLVNEGILSKTGTDDYAINKPKKFDYEFDAVKEEMDGHVVSVGNNGLSTGEDRMYMLALYHVLSMDYVSVAELQNKLDREASQTTVRKLIDKMTKEGFVEAKSNRLLGNRVIHCDLTEKKLSEVRKALDMDATEVDVNETNNKPKDAFQPGSNYRDLSTYGVLHSIGSDITRSQGRSDAYQSGSTRSEQTMSRMRENGHNTPTSEAQPIASMESYAVPVENARSNGNANNCGEADNVICRQAPQEKRFRKVSIPEYVVLKREVLKVTRENAELRNEALKLTRERENLRNEAEKLREDNIKLREDNINFTILVGNLMNIVEM